jgi:vacuolar-type H+-ATPase subunit H
MQEIVEQVLKTEAQAEKILQDARRQAAELKTQLENEIAQSIKQARLESQKQVQEQVRKAQEQAAENRTRALRTAEEESRHLLEDVKVDSLVEEVTLFVIKPEFRKD